MPAWTMSSGTSISRGIVPSAHGSAGASGAVPPRGDGDSLQPWQLFTLAGLIGATIVVFMSRGQTPAAIILLSLMVFAAAFVGLAALRTLLPLTGAAPDDTTEILGGRTRAALFREKALVLRAIKELEFDRGMGKVSDKDFVEMSARLRSRAARLIRQLDAGSLYREEIQREIDSRLGRAPAGSSPSAETPPPAPAGAARAATACAGCGTSNDRDARFCKHCGSALVSA
jgi:hypothetical protein